MILFLISGSLGNPLVIPKNEDNRCYCDYTHLIMEFNSTNSSFLECVVKCDVLTSSINFTGSETEKQQTISVKFQNSVMRFIPDDIGQVFPNMRILSIINGTLRDGLKEGFLHEGLAALTKLNIVKTPLASVDEKAFKELINLEKLTLIDCGIELLPCYFYEHSPNLTEIDYRNNKEENVVVHLINFKHHYLENLRILNVTLNCKSCFQYLPITNKTDSKGRFVKCIMDCLKKDDCLLIDEVQPEPKQPLSHTIFIIFICLAYCALGVGIVFLIQKKIIVGKTAAAEGDKMLLLKYINK
jgi:hypothetical protein